MPFDRNSTFPVVTLAELCFCENVNSIFCCKEKLIYYLLLSLLLQTVKAAKKELHLLREYISQFFTFSKSYYFLYTHPIERKLLHIGRRFKLNVPKYKDSFIYFTKMLQCRQCPIYILELNIFNYNNRMLTFIKLCFE